MLRFFRLLRLAVWRAFEHDAFAVAKAAAYSSIFTFFPTLLVVGAVLAASRRTEVYLREITYAVGRILPAGSTAAVAYLKNTTDRPVGLLITTSLITLWTASGVMISWMEGFRHAYELPKTWGLVKERLIAFSLVILAGVPLMFATILVAFGSSIETRVLFPPKSRVWLLHSADVDRHPLAHREHDQCGGHRANLPQRRASHAALAQRATWCNPGYGHVAAGHSAVRLVPAALR